VAEPTVEELKEELAATQYWLRLLYALMAYTAGDVAAEAQQVRETIKALKNQPPPDGVNPARYDEAGLRRLPHIERIGNDIAEFLEMSAGRKAP
jgi:hypothetical protein